MKPQHNKILCSLAVFCLFLTRSCDNGLDDFLELQRIMIPVSSEKELQDAITEAPDGSVIGIINNIELYANRQILFSPLLHKTITITSLDREITLKPNPDYNLPVLKITGGTLIFGDKRSFGKLILEGYRNPARKGPLINIDGGAGNKPTCIIRDGVFIQNNYSNFGGGVIVNNGAFLMEGGTIQHNEASNSGGGVWVINDGTFFIKGNAHITNNTAGQGGGVHITSTGNHKMEGNARITNNTAVSNGGGIFIDIGKFIMNGGRIAGNTALDGGGVYWTTPGNFNGPGRGGVTGNKNGDIIPQ